MHFMVTLLCISFTNYCTFTCTVMFMYSTIPYNPPQLSSCFARLNLRESKCF